MTPSPARGAPHIAGRATPSRAPAGGGRPVARAAGGPGDDDWADDADRLGGEDAAGEDPAGPDPAGGGAVDPLGVLAAAGLCEVAGRGRTSLALRAVRGTQRDGRPVAWVDGSGTFCPSTAEVDLEALTYVRPEPRRRSAGDALFAADVLLRSRAFALVVLDMPSRGGGLLSAWFRLARLAQRAGAQLLVLHDQGRRLTGSAASAALRVRLRPVPGPPWADLPPPALEIEVLRRRTPPGD